MQNVLGVKDKFPRPPSLKNMWAAYADVEIGGIIKNLLMKGKQMYIEYSS
jgi:hypothetical protein